MSDTEGHDGDCPALTDGECNCWTSIPREKTRWVDLLGIDPDFTGGKPIGEFLRESRGEA